MSYLCKRVCTSSNRLSFCFFSFQSSSKTHSLIPGKFDSFLFSGILNLTVSREMHEANVKCCSSYVYTDYTESLCDSVTLNIYGMFFYYLSIFIIITFTYFFLNIVYTIPLYSQRLGQIK